MKPLIIGEAPSKSGDGRPFSGRSGDRLKQLMGVGSYDELTGYFELRNLCRQEFSQSAAKYTARLTLIDIRKRLIRSRNRPKRLYDPSPHDSCHILMCGRKVQTAFGVQGELFTEYVPPGFVDIHLWVFPHPSGLNRYWNDHHRVEVAKQFIRRISSGCIPTGKSN